MKNKNGLLLLSVSLLAACSGGGGGGGEKATFIPNTSQEQQTVENPDGTYLAVLKPVNKQVGVAIGALTLVKEGDKFLADIRINNGHPNVVHRQNIFMGSNCPTEAMDINNDGFVDIVESAPALQGILMPLDGDLNSQTANGDYWPVGDQYGFYLWGKTASYLSIMQDLWKPDENADDNLVKLNKDQALNLVGKVVIIQGVAETQVLPDTVATMGRFNKFQTLPVACGIITKVTSAPGIIDESDEVAGVAVPEGSTVGGSSGAEDGAIERYVETDDYTTGGVAGF